MKRRIKEFLSDLYIDFNVLWYAILIGFGLSLGYLLAGYWWQSLGA